MTDLFVNCSFIYFVAFIMLDRVVLAVVGIGVEASRVRVGMPGVIEAVRHVAENPGHVGDNLRGDGVDLLTPRGDIHPGIVTHALENNNTSEDKTISQGKYLVEGHKQEISYRAGDKEENVLDDDNHVLLRTHYTHICHTGVKIII